MDIYVTAKPSATMGILTWEGGTVPCALGRSGLIKEEEKREGDGATPIGTYPLRRIFYRADRIPRPEAGLERQALRQEDGWCDAADDSNYNQFVTHPYPASAEHLWREDHLYDVVVVLGHNDAPVTAGLGSAIFFHVAKEGGEGYEPTEGCVALPADTLMEILKSCGPESRMIISLRSET